MSSYLQANATQSTHTTPSLTPKIVVIDDGSEVDASDDGETNEVEANDVENEDSEADGRESDNDACDPGLIMFL